MARILAIDYGKKRTGLAWTDPLQIIATAVGSFDTKDFLTKLKEIFEHEEVETIVLGFPTNWKNEATDATSAVKQFKNTLEKNFSDTPIVLWDERFTSKLAKQAILASGAKKKKRQDKHLVNAVSATIILQEYLDSKQ